MIGGRGHKSKIAATKCCLHKSTTAAASTDSKTEPSTHFAATNNYMLLLSQLRVTFAAAAYANGKQICDDKDRDRDRDRDRQR